MAIKERLVNLIKSKKAERKDIKLLSQIVKDYETEHKADLHRIPLMVEWQECYKRYLEVKLESYVAERYRIMRIERLLSPKLVRRIVAKRLGVPVKSVKAELRADGWYCTVDPPLKEIHITVKID